MHHLQNEPVTIYLRDLVVFTRVTVPRIIYYNNPGLIKNTGLQNLQKWNSTNVSRTFSWKIEVFTRVTT